MNTDQPKPLKSCPFCRKQPRRLHPVCGNGVACDTGDCPLRNRIIDAEAWNRRAPENRELREALEIIQSFQNAFEPSLVGPFEAFHLCSFCGQDVDLHDSDCTYARAVAFLVAQQPKEKPGQSGEVEP